MRSNVPIYRPGGIVAMSTPEAFPFVSILSRCIFVPCNIVATPDQIEVITKTILPLVQAMSRVTPQLPPFYVSPLPQPNHNLTATQPHQPQRNTTKINP